MIKQLERDLSSAIEIAGSLATGFFACSTMSVFIYEKWGQEAVVGTFAVIGAAVIFFGVAFGMYVIFFGVAFGMYCAMKRESKS